MREWLEGSWDNVKEGSRYTDNEWVSEMVAACRMAAEGKELGTQGLKGGNYLKCGYTCVFYK